MEREHSAALVSIVHRTGSSFAIRYSYLAQLKLSYRDSHDVDDRHELRAETAALEADLSALS